MFENFLLENYTVTVFGITMQGSSNRVDSKLIKPTITPYQLWGPRKEFKV